jgi:cell division protein FtsZ
MPDDDIRRRLSEAIGFEQQRGTRPLPESHREPSAETPRDGRRAPGDVVIEEGFSHLNWLAQSAHTRAREGNVSSEPVPEFRPAPPADIRRGARRMPDVEDFPPIVQREYRAKVGYSPDTAPRAPGAGGIVTDSLSRLGLLQRIMGRARGVGELASEDVANHQFDSAEDESPAASEDEIWWDDDAEAETDPSKARPESSVPAIFNRLRK